MSQVLFAIYDSSCFHYLCLKVVLLFMTQVFIAIYVCGFWVFGVGVGLVHVFLPFMILPLLGSIQAVDPAVEEASQSLGASRLKTMFKVIMPLCLPGIQAGSILVFVLTISSFVIPIFEF